jgi:V/A-type H+/Na+-transporting ATPase subunit I
MSIVPLSKITWFGLARDKEKTLAKLQELGCLHIISLSKGGELRQGAGPTQQAHEALRFLSDSRIRRRQAMDLSKFDAEDVEKKALELRDSMACLQGEKDFLSGRIDALRPWGEFSFLPLEETAGMRFWFYAVPSKDMKQVTARKGVWKVIKKDPRFTYIVVLAKEEPQDMPVARVHAGCKPLSELESRAEEVEVELEECEVRKLALTRWGTLYQRNLFLLENKAAQGEVGQLTLDNDQLFALQAWAPEKNLEALRHAAQKFRAALKEQAPASGEPVPTLLENQPLVAGGADLVTFYMTPGYRMWDPSGVVFFSFVLFFAMILSDAGYAALLSLLLIWKWRSMSESEGGRRMRVLAVALMGASIAWGIMVGSYFGVTPAQGSFLRKLKVLDLEDSGMMMLLSITIGVVHISLANIMDAWRRRKSTEVFIPLGWLGIIAGGYLLWLSGAAHLDVLKTIGRTGMGIGALALILFSAPQPNIVKRIFGGISSLTRLSSAFGDVLSYLRLFALGLAGASLASTFNGLGRQISEGIPGVGIVFAALIYLFGHILNLILSIVSCLVHGLRLNVIEFFNWSMYEEGKPFRPFVLKGGATWKD